MSFNIQNLMKQAQKMQEEMTKIQESLATEQVIGEAAGSGIQVTASGQGEVLGIKIPKEVIEQNVDDSQMLEDLVLMAIRDALNKSKKLSEEKMSALTGGLKLPGMPGMF